MRRRSRFPMMWVATVGVGLACAGAPGGGADMARLDSIAQDVWNRSLERDVQLRLREGLPIEELPDITYARAEEDAAFAQSVLDRLSAVDRTVLDHDRALSFDVLKWQAEADAEGLQYFWLQSFLTPYSSPLPALRQIFEAMPLTTPQHVAGYLALLQQVPDYVRNIRSVAQGQMERGVVVSRESMPAVVALVRATIQPPDAGPFAMAAERLTSLPAEDASALRSRTERIIVGDINPTLARLADFLEGDYATQAPPGVGVPNIRAVPTIIATSPGATRR